MIESLVQLQLVIELRVIKHIQCGFRQLVKLRLVIPKLIVLIVRLVSGQLIFQQLNIRFFLRLFPIEYNQLLFFLIKHIQLLCVLGVHIQSRIFLKECIQHTFPK